MDGLRALRFVAPGGAVGALARWGVLTTVPDDRAFEAVLALNVVGSILAGVLFGLNRPRGGRPARLSENGFLLTATGFCGGLTTFSTFAFQVAWALDQGAIARAGATAAATAGLAVLGAGLGYRVGSRP